MNSSKIIKETNSETIAFQGANGANSNLACLKFYPEMQAKAFDSFYDVFLAVENNEAKYGIIPLENSYAGRVAEIHDLLQKHDVSIFFQLHIILWGLEVQSLKTLKKFSRTRKP